MTFANAPQSIIYTLLKSITFIDAIRLSHCNRHYYYAIKSYCAFWKWWYQVYFGRDVVSARKWFEVFWLRVEAEWRWQTALFHVGTSHAQLMHTVHGHIQATACWGVLYWESTNTLWMLVQVRESVHRYALIVPHTVELAQYACPRFLTSATHAVLVVRPFGKQTMMVAWSVPTVPSSSNPIQPSGVWTLPACQGAMQVLDHWLTWKSVTAQLMLIQLNRPGQVWHCSGIQFAWQHYHLHVAKPHQVQVLFYRHHQHCVEWWLGEINAEGHVKVLFQGQDTLVKPCGAAQMQFISLDEDRLLMYHVPLFGEKTCLGVLQIRGTRGFIWQKVYAEYITPVVVADVVIVPCPVQGYLEHGRVQLDLSSLATGTTLGIIHVKNLVSIQPGPGRYLTLLQSLNTHLDHCSVLVLPPLSPMLQQWARNELGTSTPNLPYIYETKSCQLVGARRESHVVLLHPLGNVRRQTLWTVCLHGVLAEFAL
jgi:hypothetical protein